MARRYYRRKGQKKIRLELAIIIAAAAVVLFPLSGWADELRRSVPNLVVPILAIALVLAGALGIIVHRRIALRSKRLKVLTLEGIHNLHWKDFELRVIDLLLLQGFRVIRHTSSPGDLGADIIAAHDNKKYAIQVKHYQGKLNNKPIQEAFTAKEYYKCDVAMAVTNSSFTLPAQVLAASIGCILVDGEKLGEWILDYQKRALP